MLKKILRAVGFMTGLAIILAVTSIVLKPKSDVYNAVGVDKRQKISTKRQNSHWIWCF